MRISDWSSDVCSSDLAVAEVDEVEAGRRRHEETGDQHRAVAEDLHELAASDGVHGIHLSWREGAGCGSSERKTSSSWVGSADSPISSTAFASDQSRSRLRSP